MKFKLQNFIHLQPRDDHCLQLNSDVMINDIYNAHNHRTYYALYKIQYLSIYEL